MVVAVRIGACQSFARHKGHRALSHACSKPEVFIVFWKGSGSGVLDELLHVSQGGRAKAWAVAVPATGAVNVDAHVILCALHVLPDTLHRGSIEGNGVKVHPWSERRTSHDRVHMTCNGMVVNSIYPGREKTTPLMS